jgi:predicted O-methyltransferase YrrM
MQTIRSHFPGKELVLKAGLSAVANKITHKFGIHLHRWPSDTNLLVEYPVRRAPRYGYGKPAHPQILAVLERYRGVFEQVLRGFADIKPLLDLIPLEAPEGDPIQPYWNSEWFGPRDAAALMYFILEKKPARFFEIGSGMSTKFARAAISHRSLPTRITSIDPQPRKEINQICDNVVREVLQDVDLTIFDELQAGDILSFDGSHILFMDSDVSVFFLDVLPRLKPGILVHVHDIFWPVDYPPSWGTRFYAEQYILGELILTGDSKFNIKLANAFIDFDPQLREKARGLLPEDPAKLTELSPGIQGPGMWASSFWFETK